MRQLLGQLTAASPGHDHVGQQEIQLSGVGVGDLDGFCPVGRVENVIAQLLERLSPQDPSRFVVLHDEDGLAPPAPGPVVVSALLATGRATRGSRTRTEVPLPRSVSTQM